MHVALRFLSRNDLTSLRFLISNAAFLSVLWSCGHDLEHLRAASQAEAERAPAAAGGPTATKYFLDILAKARTEADGTTRTLLCPYFAEIPSITGTPETPTADELASNPLRYFAQHWAILSADASGVEGPYAIDREVILKNLEVRDQWLQTLQPSGEVRRVRFTSAILGSMLGANVAGLGMILANQIGWGFITVDARNSMYGAAGIIHEDLPRFAQISTHYLRVPNLPPGSEENEGGAEHRIAPQVLLKLKAILGLDGIENAMTYVAGKGARSPFVLVDQTSANLVPGTMTMQWDKYVRCPRAREIAHVVRRAAAAAAAGSPAPAAAANPIGAPQQAEELHQDF